MGNCLSKKGSLNITSENRDKPATPAAAPGQPARRTQYYANHGGRTNTAAVEVAAPAPPPKAEEAKTEVEKEVLKVVSVDFHIEENAKNHHTDLYELTQDREENGIKQDAELVIRRGEAFDLTVKFDRAFDKTKDDIKLLFDCGSRPRESRGTRVVLMLSEEDKPKEWGAKIVGKADGEELRMQILTPPNCLVAKWTFKFDTVIKTATESQVFRYTEDHPIYILFNPWCFDDTVYMDDEVFRKEYVLNDRGRVYRGTKKQISAKPWNFGQFEDFILPCVMQLLDESEMSFRSRGDPVLMARKISAVTNAPDDGGVLVGNWSGDYSDGTSPLAWAGSVAILEEYWLTRQPVKYGQCWVFSGVVTTLCRALGLPARSVTNFDSAHDCDGSITIDCHWTADGKPLSEHNEDSVWNFHVWNDVWMARPDLPSGFGGWQAIDATPQETSDGVYCAGPASLEALKNGLVHLTYDGPFIFAEVNADRVHWMHKPDGSWGHSLQKNSIGKNITTKAPLSNDKMFVTNMYKFPEGSQQERTAVWRAAKEGSTRKDVYEVKKQDVVIDMIEKEDAVIGDAFDVTAKIHNESDTARTVKVTLTATVVYYTGVPVKEIKSQQYSVKAPSKAAGEIKMDVTAEEYIDKLVDMCNIKMDISARVEETGQFYCEVDDFRLRKPDLVVKSPDEVKVGEEYEVEASFTNPLPRTLTKCQFTIESAGLQRPRHLKYDAVAPHTEAKITTKLIARRTGEREIVASFDSKELSDVNGTTNVTIVAAATETTSS